MQLKFAILNSRMPPIRILNSYLAGGTQADSERGAHIESELPDGSAQCARDS